MTEQRLTEMALLKVEANKKNDQRRAREDKEQEQKLPDPTPELKSQEPERPEELNELKEVEVKLDPETGENMSKYGYQVKLGNDKIVHYTHWTGRTKKQFNKSLEVVSEKSEVSEVDLENMLSMLVRDYISDPDVYLSSVEMQYMLTILREVSVSDEIQYTGVCPECKHSQIIDDKINNIYQYTPGDYPQEVDDTVSFVDIESQSVLNNSFKALEKSKDYDGITSIDDVEIALHISAGTDLNGTLNQLDEMNLKTLKSVMKGLSNCAPKMNMGVTIQCENCNKEVFFETYDIPDVFEDLIG